MAKQATIEFRSWRDGTRIAPDWLIRARQFGAPRLSQVGPFCFADVDGCLSSRPVNSVDVQAVCWYGEPPADRVTVLGYCTVRHRFVPATHLLQEDGTLCLDPLADCGWNQPPDAPAFRGCFDVLHDRFVRPDPLGLFRLPAAGLILAVTIPPFVAGGDHAAPRRRTDFPLVG